MSLSKTVQVLAALALIFGILFMLIFLIITDNYHDRFTSRVPKMTRKHKVSIWKPDSRAHFLRWIADKVPGASLIINALNKMAYFLSLMEIPLDTVALPLQAIQNIQLWFNGEISGKRCAKSLIDATFTVSGGIAGAFAGAVLGGAFGGPIGATIGAITGGMFSASVTKVIVMNLTSQIFDLPVSVAVEKAYNYFGIAPSNGNYEINKIYRQLSAKYHPDNNRNAAETFVEIQANMQLIKEDRKRKIEL